MLDRARGPNSYLFRLFQCKVGPVCSLAKKWALPTLHKTHTHYVSTHEDVRMQQTVRAALKLVVISNKIR
jgi:hypothetical protein